MKFLKIAVLLCLLPAFSLAQSPKPKPSATKPKPSATPTRKPASGGEKVPVDAAATTAARVETANTKLAAGDLDGAASLLKSAAAEAPIPIPDELWKKHLAGVPARLYFKGARAEAYEMAGSLEEKAEGNARQLLGLASFYLGVEDGAKGRHLARKVIALEPNSTLGYQALGFAHRVNFELDEAAAAFAKALELEPGSTTAKRSLAEIRRALGKSAEAAALYREMLANDASDLSAETGLVLALFDSGKRSDAESELTKALSMNNTNVMLLGNVAYWYAAQRDGDKAIEFAQRAIATDPRFIWSHIALARGYLLKGRPADAEKTLFAARQYGNFPALSYEIAAAKAAGGHYREAAEELARTFVIKDNVITTKLGGRVARDSKFLTELVGLERRASIFAPTAADDPESSGRLAALLEFKQVLDVPEPKADAVIRAADSFAAGSDKMRIHRLVFAASQLLEKKVALAKVLEMTKSASASVEGAAEMPGATAAVMASELYEPRRLAATRGEYVEVPEVQASVLSSILRGRIEDIAGWAQFNLEQHTDAVVRLRRAVGVLPVNSSWWRASLWHLATALAATGKDQEALDTYVKAYKSYVPDAFKYSIIRGLYTRIKGSNDGLESLIGADPAAPVVKTEPTSEPQIDQKPKASSDTNACSLTSSEDAITLPTTGSDLALMIGSSAGALDEIKATSSSPADISVTREIVSGVKSKAVFVIRSASGKTGDYTVRFELPCGSKVVTVKVR